MMQSKITFTTIDNLKIAENVLGEGAPIVMLHGWGANIDLMLPLAKQLAPLGYQIFVLDLPGFGQSDPPPIGWSVHDYAKFVLRYFEHHNLDQTHVVGHSFGGRLGLILGADHSQRISKLALIDSAGVRTPPSNVSQLPPEKLSFRPEHPEQIKVAKSSRSIASMVYRTLWFQ